MTWEQIYNYLGAKEFIYFISSPSIQETLFPIKVVFIFFTIVFFCAVIYFYANSSYVKYQFLQDATEFFSHESFGLAKVNKNWKKIRKRIESGNEAELKLAVIEADDFLYETLQDMDYKGDTFEELLDNIDKKRMNNYQEILDAHNIRNAIVYRPDFKLDAEQAKKILSVYEDTIKNLSLA